MRTAATALLGTAALGVGLWTADAASRNHGLGLELDRRQRLAEALTVSVDRLEWRVRAAEQALLDELARGERDEREAAGAPAAPAVAPDPPLVHADAAAAAPGEEPAP